MEKQTIFSILYVAMIIALILFMIWIVYYLKDEKKDCLVDPVGYFESRNEGASCYCMKEGVFYNLGEGFNIKNG